MYTIWDKIKESLLLFLLVFVSFAGVVLVEEKVISPMHYALHDINPIIITQSKSDVVEEISYQHLFQENELLERLLDNGYYLKVLDENGNVIEKAFTKKISDIELTNIQSDNNDLELGRHVYKIMLKQPDVWDIFARETCNITINVVE